MALFALGGHRGAGLGGGEADGDRRTMGRIGAGEHQVALDAVPHHEAWIGGQRAVHEVHRVDVILEVVLHRAIEQHGRFRAVGRDFQPAYIADHGASPV
jgi:hypothetical protein